MSILKLNCLLTKVECWDEVIEVIFDEVEDYALSTKFKNIVVLFVNEVIQNLKFIDNSDDIDSLTSEYLLKQGKHIFQKSNRLRHKTKSRTKSRQKRQDVTANQETGQSSVFIQ